MGLICGSAIADGCGGTVNCGSCGAETESNNTSATANSAVNAAVYASYLGTSTDIDWYQVSVGAGKTLTVDMRPPVTLNYDLQLYKNNSLLASGTLGAGQTEHLTYTNSTSKAVTLTIKVFGVSGAFSTSSPYYLKAAW